MKLISRIFSCFYSVPNTNSPIISQNFGQFQEVKIPFGYFGVLGFQNSPNFFTLGMSTFGTLYIDFQTLIAGLFKIGGPFAIS